VNAAMPLNTLAGVRRALGGSLAGKKLLLLGVSYRQDVGDTRYSPSEILVRALESEGAVVTAQDPLVNFWEEMGRQLPEKLLDKLPPERAFDAVIFAVAHDEYRSLDLEQWLGELRPLIFDANCVLSPAQRDALRRMGCPVGSIGRGA
jgi:UDP-N-acetyl-D-glucosamine dehydrogenase